MTVLANSYTPTVEIQPRLPSDCLVVAVDGGVATGKSSLCTTLSQRLEVPYFNAGLLYRALALWCVDQGLPLDDADGLADAARTCPVAVSLADRVTKVAVGDKDVSHLLKTTQVSSTVAAIARHAPVREVMNTHQRAILWNSVSAHGGVVIDGRDATSVVATDAPVKILLIADEKTRDARLGPDETAAAAAVRDRADAAVSDFRTPRSDVMVFDTALMTQEELLTQVLEIVIEKLPYTSALVRR